jgi:PAS domain S-box-containing protein
MTVDNLLEALPVAVYMTDSEGRITFYNSAAAELWGRRPELGSAQWCGSWKLYWPDGLLLPYDQCPMAVALKTGEPVREVEAVAERPDGTRVPFMAYPTPLRDTNGKLTGAINLLMPLQDQKEHEIGRARLATIVENSNDAIMSKTLQGIIETWNAGAVRIFGYAPGEIIGQHITRIIPPELHAEEEAILAKLRHGERIEHYETVRIARDGRRINISLTTSPVRDPAGRIVGASSIARDITEQTQARQTQELLVQELNHRVKNMLATIQAIATQSLSRSSSPAAFVTSFVGRVQALARAHDLLVQGELRGAWLADIVREQVLLGETTTRIALSGPPVRLGARLATHVALVLHELATNARKHGGLATPEGGVSITWRVEDESERTLVVEWRETGGRDVRAPEGRGFGTTLIEKTLESSGGGATMRYHPDGLGCDIRVPLPEAEEPPLPQRPNRSPEEPKQHNWPAPQHAVLEGKRVLVIEDEPLIAMQMLRDLADAGARVVGPAGNLDAARRLITEAQFDAALLDVNLAGQPVDELAVMLSHRQVPFAFATGYHPDAIPPQFRHRPLLIKPFLPEQLLSLLERLLRAPEQAADRAAGNELTHS